MLTNVDMLVTNVTSRPSIGNSDHNALEFTAAVIIDTDTCVTGSPSAVRKYKWASTDFQSMSMHLTNIDWVQVAYTNPSGSNLHL